jgi:hypothetical protein
MELGLEHPAMRDHEAQVTLSVRAGDAVVHPQLRAVLAPHRRPREPGKDWWGTVVGVWPPGSIDFHHTIRVTQLRATLDVHSLCDRMRGRRHTIAVLERHAETLSADRARDKAQGPVN